MTGLNSKIGKFSEKFVKFAKKHLIFFGNSVIIIRHLVSAGITMPKIGQCGVC